MKTDAKSVLDFENPKTNDHGALYEPGRPFGRLKWFEVLEHYYAMLKTRDEVYIRKLVRSARFPLSLPGRQKKWSNQAISFSSSKAMGGLDLGQELGLSR